jgi:Trypsin
MKACPIATGIRIYVGALGVDPDGDGPQTPQIWCSGSVVSDSVFLTAAHCIVAQPPEAGGT